MDRSRHFARDYYSRHQGPTTQAEYLIALAGIAAFWMIVCGSILFSWLQHGDWPEWLWR